MKTTQGIPVFSGCEYFPEDSLVYLCVGSRTCSRSDFAEAVMDLCSPQQRFAVINTARRRPPGASGASAPQLCYRLVAHDSA